MTEQPPARPKRRYDNTFRMAQARAVRRMVADAATELFERKGYAATSMEGVAELADVPISTVYRMVGSKTVLLGDVLGDAITDEPVFVLPGGSATADDIVAALASHAAALHGGNGHLYRILQSAAPADEPAAELLASTDAQRLAGHTAAATALADMGAMPEDLTVPAAVDLLHTLLSPEVHRLLTRDRAWTDAQYEAWLRATLRAQLLDRVTTSL